jgi:hypothetical protein
MKYLIDQLPSGILGHMLSNQVDELWDPTIEDIEHVYEHTSDMCPLRELLIICFVNTSREKQTIIPVAPEAFVRGYALHVSDSRYDSIHALRFQYTQSTLGCSKVAALEFGTTLIFPLCDSDVHQRCRQSEQCDGQRPFCSTCVRRGLTNCLYDLSRDMRKTSGLKEKINHLLDGITSVRKMALTLIRGYNIPQDPRIVQLVEQTLCHGRWSYLPELSRVLDQHAASMSQAVRTPQSPDGHNHLPVAISSFPPQHAQSVSYVGDTNSPVERSLCRQSQLGNGSPILAGIVSVCVVASV